MGTQRVEKTIDLRQSNGKMERDGMHLIRWLAYWVFDNAYTQKKISILNINVHKRQPKTQTQTQHLNGSASTAYVFRNTALYSKYSVSMF